MHLLVCYDVVKDSRRVRLFRRLSAFLVPVEKSVFEGPLPDWRLSELVRTIETAIDPDTDTVLFEGSSGRVAMKGVGQPRAESNVTRS